MANALPHEKELYDKIRDEHITIHPFIWDTLYYYLGDYITAVHFVAAYYVLKNEPIPVEDGRKILNYSRQMNELVRKILHHEKIVNENKRLEKIKEEDLNIPPVLREIVSHHIGNDLYGINVVVSFHLDPQGEEPIPLEHAQHILNYTQAMRSFLDKLRVATHREVGY